MSNELDGFTKAQRFWAWVALVLSFLLVGGVAAVMSYTHIKDVTIIAHQPVFLAHLMPLSIDGMMLIATVAMVQDKAYGRESRAWARSGFWFGLGVSVAANVSSVVVVWGWDWLGIVAAGLPPVLLLWSVEIVSKPGRVRKVAQVIAAVGEHLQQATRATPAGINRPSPEHSSARTSATPADDTGSISNGSVPVVRRGRPEDDEPLPEELVRLAMQVGGAWRTRTGRVITRDGLRNGLREAGWRRGISNVTASRLLALLSTNNADEHGRSQDQAVTPQGDRVPVTADAH